MSRAQILIVEDDSLVAQDLKERLIEQGYGVPAVASSGEEAIQKAVEIQPNLVQALDAEPIWETLEARGIQATPEVIRLSLTRDAARTLPDSPSVASSSYVGPAHARDDPPRLGLRGRIGHRWVL